MMQENRRYFVVRGTLPSDAPSYVTRQADAELLDCLRDGDFCCVLSSRQMGKSSLMVRTALRLKQEGASVAIVDLSGVGRDLTVAQWYMGLLSYIGQWLDLEEEIEAFWMAHERLSPLQRWKAVLREVVLAKEERSVVIFIDEIDFVLTLPFSTDEFFAAIRECYNRRTQEPAFNRLTFCLLGVATPSDLIRDTRATPFNIGRRVQVTDFTRSEAAPLSVGLFNGTPAPGDAEAREENAISRHVPGSLSNKPESNVQNSELLDRVLYWTGGHPYLTQRLCARVAECAGRTASHVDRACEDLFLSASVRDQEDNLMFVRDRLLGSSASRAELLTLYGQVWAGKRIRNDETNPLISVLKLSGIVRVEEGYLRVRNRIYERAFDRAWVIENMPDAELRRQKAAYWRGIAIAALGSASIIGVMAVLAFLALKFAYEARENERKAKENHYSVDMVLGMQAWASGNLGFAQNLLNQHSHEDIRGFEWYLLTRLCRGDELWRSEPLKQAVNEVAIAPDGKVMAAAGEDDVVFWDLHSHLSAQIPVHHAGGANSLAFAPDGKSIAIGWGDGTLSLWSIVGRRETTLHDPGVKATDIRRVAFAPAGGRLAAADYDGTVTLWDTATHKLLSTHEEEADNIQSLAFSPDSKVIAVGLYDRVVWLGAESLRSLRTFPAKIGFIQCVQFSRDGKWMAASGFGRNVLLWNIASKRQIRLQTTHLGTVAWLAFSQDGTRLATGSSDATLMLWDLRKEPFEKICTFRGHTAALSSLTFLPGSRTVLATSSGDGTVRLWDMAKPPEPRVLPTSFGPILSVVISPDRTRLAAGSNDGHILIWNLNHLRDVPDIIKAAHASKVYALSFSPTGDILASASADYTVKLWRLDQDHVQGITAWRADKDHFNRMLAVAFSPDGTRLAATGWDKIVRVWRVPAHQLIQRIFDSTPEMYQGPTASDGSEDRLEGNALAISPDSRILAAPSKHHKVYLWRLADGAGRRPEVVPARDDKIDTVAFSPDGRLLAFGSEDKTVVLYDLKTHGRTLHSGHTSSVWSMAFSPDSRTLATAGPDLSVKLWNTWRNNEIATLNGHTNAVMAVAFSRDGKLLVSSDYDGNVILWRADTGIVNTKLPR